MEVLTISLNVLSTVTHLLVTNVGKVGYAFDMYNEKQVNQLNLTIEKKFLNIPELLEIWRKCGVKT